MNILKSFNGKIFLTFQMKIFNVIVISSVCLAKIKKMLEWQISFFSIATAAAVLAIIASTIAIQSGNTYFRSKHESTNLFQ